MDEREQVYTALEASLRSLNREWRLERSDLDLLRLSKQFCMEKPPRADLGDWACPCFFLAKELRHAPAKIAESLSHFLSLELDGWKIVVVGAYLNFHLPHGLIYASTVFAIAKQAEQYGSNQELSGQKIMLEFSSPNTNKPLHLGHLRNNVLGESVSRILKHCGANVYKVSIFNDRGVHICKSMLAYQRFGQQKKEEETFWMSPENTGIRGDFFVGDYYVRFNDWQSTEQIEKPEELAQNMLMDWERGDAETLDLWKRMRKWAIDGIETTYARCDISFDQKYYESETYTLGKEIIAEGLAKGIFFRRDDGAVLVDLAEHHLGEKVVQRSDGTSVYITQDLGTAVARYRDYPFDRQIYVVANEQDYHFKVLFRILQLLGYEWAHQLYHLSYNMVVLPNGKMKSREGTVVDADVLLDELEASAFDAMRQRGRIEQLEYANREQEDGDSTREVASKIALGALHFYLLQFSPLREISFNPTDSLSFTGNTGPYLQYMCVRIYSIFRKIGESPILDVDRLQKLGRDAWYELEQKESQVILEWELLKQLRDFPRQVVLAAEDFNPAHIIKSLTDIARCFSRFYHEESVLHCANPKISLLRIELCRATLQVLQNGMRLTVIPYMSMM